MWDIINSLLFRNWPARGCQIIVSRHCGSRAPALQLFLYSFTNWLFRTLFIYPFCKLFIFRLCKLFIFRLCKLTYSGYANWHIQIMQTDVFRVCKLFMFIQFCKLFTFRLCKHSYSDANCSCFQWNQCCKRSHSVLQTVPIQICVWFAVRV